MITREMLADAMGEIDPAIIDEHVKRVSPPKVAARYVISAVIYAAACIAVVLILPFILGGDGNEHAIIPGESVTTEVSETTSETEAPEPDPESNYKWVIEPGIYSGDIQPVFGWYGKAVNIGLVVLDDKYLVDYNGNIKYTLPDKADQKDTGYSFCDVCNIILCSDGVITPDTYEIANNMGHGGNFVINYIYDSETGFICYDDYGGYTEETENIPYAIVAEGIRRPSTPEDGVYNDYAYDKTGRYGIVVNSKLVVPFEYDAAVKYDSFGIAKLRKDGKWAFFNSEGEMILGNDYLSYYETTDGYIPLNRDGKWGYADLEGNIVIDHVFEEARSVYCGKAWVKTDAGWGVIEVYEPEIMTEEEAKQIVLDRFSEANSGATHIVNVEITPNGKSYYECVGYGFDVKVFYDSGIERTGNWFVNFDGSIFVAQYYFDEEKTDAEPDEWKELPRVSMTVEEFNDNYNWEDEYESEEKFEFIVDISDAPYETSLYITDSNYVSAIESFGKIVYTSDAHQLYGNCDYILMYFDDIVVYQWSYYRSACGYVITPKGNSEIQPEEGGSPYLYEEDGELKYLRCHYRYPSICQTGVLSVATSYDEMFIAYGDTHIDENGKLVLDEPYETKTLLEEYGMDKFEDEFEKGYSEQYSSIEEVFAANKKRIEEYGY